MVIEKSNFIIYYDEELSYIPEVVEYLELRMDEIMCFFKLDSLSSKKKIIVYNDLELYKRHIEKFYQYQDYMRADTNDGKLIIQKNIHK